SCRSSPRCPTAPSPSPSIACSRSPVGPTIVMTAGRSWPRWSRRGWWSRATLHMADHHQRRAAAPDTVEALAHGLGIEGAEALVEQHELGPLQQRAGEEQAGLLAV